MDQLGVWDCALSPFTAFEEIPAIHREAWGVAMDKVHRKLWEAEEHGSDLDRALKWWLFLPQALCRKAIRGGRAGVGQIRKRFNCIVEGNHGELVRLWLHDRQAVKSKDETKKRKGKPAVNIDKKTRQAVSLISKGQVSKAVSIGCLKKNKSFNNNFSNNLIPFYNCR